VPVPPLFLIHQQTFGRDPYTRTGKLFVGCASRVVSDSHGAQLFRRKKRPDRGEKEERLRAISEMILLRKRFAKLDIPEGLIPQFASPPHSPKDCIFALTTQSLSADFRTKMIPCLFGGNPDCGSWRVRSVDGLGGGSGTQARRRYLCWKDLQSLNQDWSGKVEKCATADSAIIARLTVVAKRLTGAMTHRIPSGSIQA